MRAASVLAAIAATCGIAAAAAVWSRQEEITKMTQAEQVALDKALAAIRTIGDDVASLAGDARAALQAKDNIIGELTTKLAQAKADGGATAQQIEADRLEIEQAKAAAEQASKLFVDSLESIAGSAGQIDAAVAQLDASVKAGPADSTTGVPAEPAQAEPPAPTATTSGASTSTTGQGPDAGGTPTGAAPAQSATEGSAALEPSSAQEASETPTAEETTTEP